MNHLPWRVALIHCSPSNATKYDAPVYNAVHSHAGPVTAEAIFLNREELPVRPIYYDPIHDFGEPAGHLCPPASPFASCTPPNLIPRHNEEAFICRPCLGAMHTACIAVTSSIREEAVTGPNLAACRLLPL